ncbi:S1/P1 nuclease [Cellulophaga sp. 20_2_10]|uniref:S1/P1 nuclease n=1 Tax=Cellulophaga sp. 20_2_10 TaxID=2942476 RepID=UPI00201AC57B|nr:S1/P1 nuclease [Cellulophaga sp. 20_2_10]MCL5247017.1 S1/P1 nuclease [Cellulophaga sp. 20_2_10]
MKNICILLFLAVQVSFANNVFWGKTGHRTVGEVAQKELSRKAKKAIKELLDGQDLAFASNHADDIKSDRTFKAYSPWHYVNFPADKKYTDITPPPEGDLMVGIEKCLSVLKDKNSSKKDKSFHLKMLIHLIGDMHQPLHAGHAEDKGGNDIQVRWFNDGTNLHRVWDSDMINSYGMSYTELAGALPKLNKKEVAKIQDGTVYDWIEESQDLAEEVYKSAEVGEKLGYRYSYLHMDQLRGQLLKGGLRLAKVLNDLYK